VIDDRHIRSGFESRPRRSISSRSAPNHDDVMCALCPHVSSFYTEAGRGYTMIQPGRYRHYKGQDYEVLGLAKHSETEEEFVVYRALYGERGLWIRPVAMFSEMIQVEGKHVPRFLLLELGPL
jgi:hypothetical protein